MAEEEDERLPIGEREKLERKRTCFWDPNAAKRRDTIAEWLGALRGKAGHAPAIEAGSLINLVTQPLRC